MSSSSSDSDSDDIEPIRKIKINIKPKDYVAKKEGADIEAIKASVEAWRPLGPRPHPSLTRRQSSLSSMSSLSFGMGSNQGGLNSTTATPNSVTSASANNQYSNYQFSSHNPATSNTAGSGLIRGNINTETAATTTTTATTNLMRSSPSCSSLVNEFNNRASFSNFMSNASRTSSPLTFMGGNGFGVSANYSETSVPLALAIQESIELTVRGQQGHQAQVGGGVGGEMKTRFEIRALGNIKVAFPNSFARLCSTGASDKQIPVLKLRLHSTENIVRYYASGLVKDLDSESGTLAGTVAQNSFTTIKNNNNNMNSDASLGKTSTNGTKQHQDLGENNYDLFDMNESPARRKGNTKIIEFDMVALIAQLKKVHDQTPSSRYYNVDVLRYQIMPLDEFEKCPLQVCAYWKVEPKLIKLRVDFKHSNLSGLTLERLREISFTANLSNLVPSSLSVQPVSPHLVSTLTPQTQARTSSTTNNSQEGVRNLATNNKSISYGDCNRGQQLTNFTPTTAPINQLKTSTDFISQTNGAIQMPPPPQPAPRQINNSKNTTDNSAQPIRLPPPPSSSHSRTHHHSRATNLSSTTTQMTGMDTLRKQPSPFLRNQSGSSSSSCRSDSQSITSGHSNTAETSSILDQLLGLSLDTQRPLQNQDVNPAAAAPLLSHHYSPPEHLKLQKSPTASTGSSTTAATPTTVAAPAPPTMPYITYEPQAHWDNQTKQLVWRFDNLLSFYKSDGYGSLLAKLDFRPQQISGDSIASSLEEPQASEQQQQQQQAKPNPIDIKFMVVDSTLSKISLTIDSAGYRMSLLRKEVRSGRYKSEPYIF